MYDPLQDYYVCDSCGDKKLSMELSSMACRCGGGYRTYWNGGPSLFEPHYCHELKSYVSSWKDKERVAQKQGCRIIDGSKVKDYRRQKKNMPDITREAFKRDGYKVGKDGKARHISEL